VPSEELEIRDLGTGVDYLEALNLQQELVQKRIKGEIPNTILFLEHCPVYTIGRTKDKSSLSAPSQLPYPVHEISRGGQATYHGPGQLVGYPIIDLKPIGRDLAVYLRGLEQALIASCLEFGVTAKQREGLTGIWIGNQKLASIGIGVKKWVTYHGFAINLTKESLPPFQHITPCGLTGVSTTYLEQHAPKRVGRDALQNSFLRELSQLVGTLNLG